MSVTGARGRREASDEDQQRLLARLNPDPSRAWQAHDLLRRKLIAFFEYSHPVEAQELAEQTLDRVAKKSCEIENVFEFAFGVARNIRREASRRARVTVRFPDGDGKNVRVLAHDVEDSIIGKIDSNRKMRLFLQCMQQLNPDERNLILRYYPQTSDRLEDERRELATSIGIGLGALRTRVTRLREKLEVQFRRLSDAASAKKRI